MDEQNIEKRKNWTMTTPKPTLVRSILGPLGLAFDGQELSIESRRQPAAILSALASKVDSSDRWRFRICSDGKYIGRVKDQSFELV